MFRINDKDNPVIIDFSSAYDCNSQKPIFTYIQSRFYRAPEVLLGYKPITNKIDVWSLGCVLVELYIGLPLFPGSSSYDQLSKIMQIVGYCS